MRNTLERPSVGFQVSAIRTFSGAAGAVLSVQGSATKYVKITKVVIYWNDLTSTTPTVSVRQTTTSPGTPTSIGLGSLDPANLPTGGAYTSAGAVGTSLGNPPIYTGKSPIGVPFSSVVAFDAGDAGAPILLDGIAKFLEVDVDSNATGTIGAFIYGYEQSK